MAPALSEVKITLLMLCKIDKSAEGDWSHQLRDTLECYFLAERGHFPISNMQLRRHAGLFVEHSCRKGNMGDEQGEGRGGACVKSVV